MPDETANGEDVLANEPRYADGEKEKVKALERLTKSDGVEVMVIVEYKEQVWNESSPSELSDQLDDERVAELEEGAEPSEEELSLWEEHQDFWMQYWDNVYLYRVSVPQGEAWVWMVMDGNHQGSTFFDGAGPFSSLDEAMPSLLAYGAKWQTWFLYHSNKSSEADRAYEQVIAYLGEPIDWNAPL